MHCARSLDTSGTGPSAARLALSVLVLLAIVAPGVAAARMAMPPLAAVERGAYRARDVRTGEVLWQAEWTLNRVSDGGRPVLRLEEEGREAGERSAPDVWSNRMSLDLGGAHPVLTATREARDAAGRLLEIEEREFNYDVGSGRVVTTAPQTGARETRSVRLTGQAITTELLPAILRLLPGTHDHQMRFDLVMPDGRMLPMRAAVAGREWVRVPAGVFECYKVELQPTGLVGALAGLKLPRLFMWQTVAAPHFWVKYQGPDGGVASREIVRELIRFETVGPTAPLSMTAPDSRTEGARVAARGASDGPHGRRMAMPPGLGYLLVLAAIVFEIGVEATRLLSD